MKFGQTEIADIVLDPKSRDDIPQLLPGLQHLNLLHDAVRKVIEGCAELSEAQGLAGWRQSAYRLRQFKKS